MAVVVVTNSNNRRNDAEATTNWSSDGGGGAGPQNEPDFFYQGTQAVSRKIGTTLGGLKFTEPSVTIDMTAAVDSLIMMKGVWANSANVAAAPSARFKIGAGSNFFAYQVMDDGTRGDMDAPPVRLWVPLAINPNVETFIDEATSTAPSLTAIDFFSIQGDFGGSSKSENVIIDALDISPGLWLVGGDSTDPDGTFLDFQSHDEDTIGNRFGHFVTIGNTFFLQGRFVIGRNASATVTATVFTDENRVIEFPANRVGPGDNELELDLGNASTVVTITACVFTGAGKGFKKAFFNAVVDTNGGEVTNATDIITIVGHPFETGEIATYSISNFGTPITGLTDLQSVFIRKLSADTFTIYLASSGTGRRNNAYTDTSRINISGLASGNQSHFFNSGHGNLPDFSVTGTNGSATYESCTFNNTGTHTLNAQVTYSNCAFNTYGSIVASSGGVFTGCVFKGWRGDAINASDHEGLNGSLLISDLTDISDCEFTSDIQLEKLNVGSAIEIDTTGTYTFSGNKFNGYGPTSQFFNAQDDVDSGNDTITLPAGHGFVSGDVVFYNDRGGTPISGLNDQRRYYISVSGNDIQMHNASNLAVSAGSSANLTAGSDELHSIESANASILNSSGGLVTINVVDGGDIPTIRDTDGSTTVVNNLVTVTVNGITEGTSVKIVADETVGTVTIGDTLFEGFADNNGEASYSQNYEEAFDPSGLDVIVRARNSGIATAVIADDNGVLNDETLEGNNSTANNLILLPATPVVNQDSYMFGHDEEFGQLRIDVSTVGTGGFTITWEYRTTSDTWVALSDVVDGTNSFANSGPNIVSWTIPGNWKAETFNGQGPFKYVRARYTAGSVTVTPIGRKVTLDVTRYLPFNQNNTILSTGLTVTASWVEDTVAIFG